MSGTGNEFERPGVNYPDREDSTEGPEPGEPARDEGQEPASAGAPEPTHEAVGIGVMDSPDGVDHHGQDGGRDTLTVGEAQRTSGGLGSEQEQRLPAMSQNDASTIDKVSGIVAQTRSDVGIESTERIAEVLRQRFEQSGIDLPDADVDELAQQISTGDASEPETS
jgi:hypothetical protein